MATAPTMLFSWADVECLPDLKRLERVLEHLPDGPVLEALQARRGHGRNEYPVAAMWRALVAGVVFQHESLASLRRALRRNPALLQVCGFDPLGRHKAPTRTVERGASGEAVVVSLPGARHDGVPEEWTFSRFVANVVKLEEDTGALSAMLETLRGRLMEALPQLGRHLGYDGKALESHSTGRTDPARGTTSDPGADWGRHQTGGVDRRTGRAWKKVKSWFGYRLHLIADTHYELPVWFEVTEASRSEFKVLCAAVDELFGQQPSLAQRCTDFSADRGLDGAELKAKLWDEYRIRPLIDTREMWREEKQEPGYDRSKPIMRALCKDRADNVVHTEKGEVSCRCPVTKTYRAMAFQGFEADRQALKYRCPAAAYALECRGREACHRAAGVNAGEYGRIVRIALPEHDRRIFTPTPWGSPSWRRGYRRRTALERINARIDNRFGFEHHFVRGRAKMKARVGLALCVMMALALGAVTAGRPERMRSLVAALPRLDTG